MTDIKKIKFSELCHFTEKQLEATRLMDGYKFLLYGGAMGGGKSYWLRWVLLRFLLKQYSKTKQKGIRVALFCEDYPSLKDRHLSKIKFEFPDWLGELRTGDSEFQLKPEYGSGILAFRNLDDVSKYQSSEFSCIAIDEITKNTKDVFDYLRTRLRWPGIKDVKFICASNPGGIGHNWVKNLWMNREYEAGEMEKDQFYFLSAKVADNPYLDKGYITQLQGLPEEMKKAYLEGDWNLFKGQYFSEWRDERHVIKPFVVPDGWRKFAGLDFGRTNPFAFLWFTLDYDGNVYCYREYYESGVDAQENARNVLRLNRGERLEYVVADSSVFAKAGHSTQSGMSETIADELRRGGMGSAEEMSVIIPSSKDRVAGWTFMHEYLSWNDKKEPKLKFFSTCTNSIKTIPSLIYNEKHGNPEDLDTSSEDHAADATRYFLQTLRERKTKPPLSSVDKKLEQMKQATGYTRNFNKMYYDE